MQKARELFIYNETYPLPLDKYAEFKSRRDNCAGNPMCINRLKFDAETFIADFGKKHGSKIETGEESSFIILKDSEQKIQQKITQIKEKDNSTLIVASALIILGAFAIFKNNLSVGVITILLAILILSIQPNKIKTI
jgi:hypothetical protein